jgi:hypothetical protein
LFRFFGFRKRGRKAVAAPQNREAYSEALLAGWVTPPEARAPESQTEPAQAAEQDDAVLERFYRNQQ